MPTCRPDGVETATAYRPESFVDLDDGALAVAARSRPEVFASIYERYLGPVYRFCYVRLGQREAAQDATSEIFLKAFSGLSGYRNGLFAAWLYRIAHNVVTDAHRRRRPVTQLGDAGTLTARDLAPDEAAAAAVQADTLRAALALLPDEQRAAVELGQAGWSTEEIALALDKTPAAVKMLRYRGFERLRTILSAHDPRTTARRGEPR